MKQLKDQTAINESDKLLLSKCKRVIENIDPLARIILYGSKARGEANKESDYDLVIVTEGEVSLLREDEHRKALFPIELETGAVLTVFLVEEKDWNSSLYAAMPFRQNVEREGVVL